jgi:hypothetical protein
LQVIQLQHLRALLLPLLALHRLLLPPLLLQHQPQVLLHLQLPLLQVHQVQQQVTHQ